MIKETENNRYRDGSIKKSQLTKRQASYKGPSIKKVNIFNDEIDADLSNVNIRIIKARKEENAVLLAELLEMKEKLMFIKREKINRVTMRTR